VFDIAVVDRGEICHVSDRLTADLSTRLLAGSEIDDC